MKSRRRVSKGNLIQAFDARGSDAGGLIQTVNRERVPYVGGVLDYSREVSQESFQAELFLDERVLARAPHAV